MKTWIKGFAFSVSVAMILGASANARGQAPKAETTCGDYGTSVHFEDSPVKAAQAAKKDGKLVMVLHISGHFEDPALT